ncbi:MAG: hypothetical protein ACYDH6_16160 [Acidimicrobiales bacterium]
MGRAVWDVLDQYLDQDRVWPAPDGTEIELDAMTPAHRLCVLLALETPHPTAPLVVRLRQLVGL